MILISSRDPDTATYPVAPLPTESLICKIGGLITSYPLPLARTFIPSSGP